jgi:diguanylate cyclase (GGDEF)-like protein
MQSITNSWKRFVKFITFVNLPIKKKFLLFGLGTFFWFFLVGVVAVTVLTFIHYRYSQLTNTTMPYIQTIQKVSPKLDALEQLSKWEHTKNQNKQLLEATLCIRSMLDAVTQTTINMQGTNKNGNFFEMLTYSLSKDDPKGITTLQEILGQIKKMETTLSYAYRISNDNIQEDLSSSWKELTQDIKKTKEIVGEFSERTTKMHEEYSQQMNKAIKFSINTIAIIILLAISLLWFFTRWLTDAFSKPIESMIHQIHAIGTGEVDLSKKLKIKSEDEIGTLSKEFNKLVDTVYGVTVFKKVIEEDTSLDVVYTRLGEVFERDAGIKEYRIYDINDAKQTMKVVHPPLFGDETLACHDEILNNCSLCRAQKTGHKISSFEYSGICRQFIPEDGKEHVCIPLIVAGKPGAVVQFTFDRAQNDEEVEDIHERIFKAESYIKNSLSVIETKQLMHTLRESSLVDGLTGLYNRRFLQDHSNQLIAGVLRRKKQISLLMCDMDFFKQVNDTYGHDTGDSLLKETSAIFRKSIRESDVVIRFGGEEFLILLIDTEPEYGMQVADKIRQKVEETNFKSPTGILKKTISIGVSEFPKDTEGFWQAIKFADVALYKAKNSGRNKCIRFTSELWDQKDNF